MKPGPKPVNPPSEASPAQSAEPPTVRLRDEMYGLFADTRVVVLGHLALLALEAQRAGRALGTLVACGLAAALLLVCAWVSMGVALALWLVERGATHSLAVLGTTLVNVAGVALMGLVIRNAAVGLTFPATRKSLATPVHKKATP